MGLFDKVTSRIQDAKEAVQSKTGFKVTEEELRSVIADDETVVDTISQSKMTNPVTIICTDKRLIFYVKGLMKNKNTEMTWKEDIKNVGYSEKLTGAVFEVESVNALDAAIGETFGIDKKALTNKFEISDLRKEEAQPFYKKMKATMNQYKEIQRERDLEDKRAAAGGTTVSLNQGFTPPPQYYPQQMPGQNGGALGGGQVAAGLPAPASKKDQLKELKEMLEDGLINQDEFDDQKTKILAA